MIIEQRTYTLVPGKVPEYLSLYEKEGLEVQKAHLGRLVGYYYSDIGIINQIIHLWAYSDYADREGRRAKLFKDSQWLAYFQKVIALIQHQESKILLPAPFFEIL